MTSPTLEPERGGPPAQPALRAMPVATAAAGPAPTSDPGADLDRLHDAIAWDAIAWTDRASMEELLLKRFGAGARPTWLLRVQIGVKRLAWSAVVRSAHVLKRALDIALAGPLLLVLLPFLTLLGLLIRLESPGPALFQQVRVGRYGRLFPMYKFRSMYRDAEARKAALLAQNESAGGVIFKMRGDPRITRVGRFIRKASIDELPQLWNVVRGDMSLVGPRPALPSEVNAYSLADRRRLEVTPGITGLWQVSGRSDIPFPQQVELDVRYIESQSLWTDLKLLALTVPAVLLGRGAY